MPHSSIYIDCRFCEIINVAVAHFGDMFEAEVTFRVFNCGGWGGVAKDEIENDQRNLNCRKLNVWTDCMDWHVHKERIAHRGTAPNGIPAHDRAQCWVWGPNHLGRR